MLYEFVDLNRDLIISCARDRVRTRRWPAVAAGEVEHGVPLFLTQLSGVFAWRRRQHPFRQPPSARPRLATEGTCSDWAIWCPRSFTTTATSAKRSRHSRSSRARASQSKNSILSVGNV